MNLVRTAQLRISFFNNSSEVFKAIGDSSLVVLIDGGGNQVAAIRELGSGWSIVIKKSFCDANKLADSPERKSWEKYFDGWENVYKHDDVTNKVQDKPDTRSYFETEQMGKVAMSAVVKNILQYTGKKTKGLVVYGDKNRQAVRNQRSADRAEEVPTKPKDPGGYSYEYQAYLSTARNALQKRLELHKGKKSKSFEDVNEVRDYFMTAKKFDEKTQIDGFIYVLSKYGDGDAGKKYGLMKGQAFKVQWDIEEESPKMSKLKEMIEAAKKNKDKKAAAALVDLIPPQNVVVTFKAIVTEVSAGGESWRKSDLKKFAEGDD